MELPESAFGFVSLVSLRNVCFRVAGQTPSSRVVGVVFVVIATHKELIVDKPISSRVLCTVRPYSSTCYLSGTSSR